MLKGRTKIILTDVRTGEEVVHEDCNLVTNALDKLININMGMNIAPNNYLLPVATKALGGIMLFDGELTESADNIHFPVEAHLVGYGDQNVNVSDSHRGSYNVLESGKTATGYVSVWDFGTAQANGTIRAVARTSYFAGANPLRFFDAPTYGGTSSGAPSTDDGWVPIRYDGEYLYMLKGNSDTHLMRLARVRIPMFSFGVADYSDVERTYEVIASWNTEVFSYSYRSSGREYDVIVYADSPLMYEDGQDGYIYCMFNGIPTGRESDYEYKLHYFTIKYSDGTFDKSETYRSAVSTGDYGYSDTARYPGRHYGHVNRGIYYKLGSNRKTLHIIPLSDPAAFSTVRLFPDDSQDYIASLYRVSPNKGGVYLLISHYTGTGSEWRNGFCYPDGVYLIPDIPGNNDDRNWGYMTTLDRDLTMFAANRGSSAPAVYRAWVANYLGTINNLASPITKTASQTMKIIYTLTDIGEENESEEI